MALLKTITTKLKTLYDGTGVKSYVTQMKSLKKISDNYGLSMMQLNAAMGRAGTKISESGKIIQDVGCKTSKMSRAMQTTRRASIRPFRGDLLSLMFIGQGVAAMFGGMINPVLKLSGVFDVWRATLISVLGPVLFPLAEILISLMSKFMNLPEPVKKVIGVFVLIGFAIGKVVAILAPLALLWTAIHGTLAGFGTALGWVAGIVVGLITIGYGAYKMWQSFSDVMVSATERVKTFLSGLKWLAVGIAVIAGTIALLISGPAALVAAIVGVVSVAVAAIAHFFQILEDKWQIFSKMWAGVKQFGSSVKGFFGFGNSGSSSIPKLAAGGIVRRPTLAMIGEKGPEAVVPLSGGGAGMNFSPTININNPNISSGMDIDRIARDVTARMYSELKRLGIR